MKRIIKVLAISISGLLFSLIAPTKSFAQAITLFHETMGINASGNPLVDVHSGFDNYSNPNISFFGTGDVRSTTSSNYPGASGNNNVFLGTGMTFIITGIEIGNHDNLEIYFGLHKSRIAENGGSIKILATIDGIDIPIPISMPSGSGTSKWYEITTTQTFPVGAILNLSFENIGTSTNSFRIDDIHVTGFATSPTPIHLAKFTAKRVENKSEILWTTATEYNHDYFEIERATDGKNFETIGSVPSKNNNAGASYEFIDYSALSGMHYYRLRSVDLDGKIEYSWVVSISETEATFPKIQLISNVVTSHLTLSVKSAKIQNIAYGIYSLDGKYVLQNSMHLDSSANLNINISSIAPGMYILKTKSGQVINQFKFIKK